MSDTKSAHSVVADFTQFQKLVAESKYIPNPMAADAQTDNDTLSLKTINMKLVDETKPDEDLALGRGKGK